MESCNRTRVFGSEDGVGKGRGTSARCKWYIPGVVWYAIALLAHMHSSEQALGAAPAHSHQYPAQTVQRFQASYFDKRVGSKLTLRPFRFCEMEQYLAFRRHRMQLRGGHQPDGEPIIALTKVKLHGKVVDAGVPAQRLSDKIAERIINEVRIGGNMRIQTHVNVSMSVSVDYMHKHANGHMRILHTVLNNYLHVRARVYSHAPRAYA
jgi:hypothetical protein